MDRPFHVSRSTAQFVRRRRPYRDNGAYSISSYTRSQKDEWMKDQASGSVRTSIDNRICTDESVQAYQATRNTSHQHVDISSQSPNGLNKFKLGTKLKDCKTRHYNHYLRLNENGRVSDPSSRRRLRSKLKYIRYIPFNQVPLTSSIGGFPPAGWCSGRPFSTSAAVRPIEPSLNDATDILYSPPLC